MDKREEKSLEAIHNAMNKLMSEKSYEEILISDILNESGVSRSTFYKHFKCKNDVLRNICHHIFHHVFSPNLKKETGHDFSDASVFDYKHLITHIFYHIQEERELISGILKSDAAYVFINEFKDGSSELINALVNQKIIYKDNISTEIQIYTLKESLISLLTFWVKNSFKEQPETLSDIFFSLHQ